MVSTAVGGAVVETLRSRRNGAPKHGLRPDLAQDR